MNGSLELPDQPCPFDRDIYQGVRAIIPPERLGDYLKSLQGQLREAFNDDGAREAIATTSHKIVSQAGMLGFARLSQVAREVEESARAGSINADLLSHARQAADEAGLRLGKLLKELQHG